MTARPAPGVVPGPGSLPVEDPASDAVPAESQGGVLSEEDGAMLAQLVAKALEWEDEEGEGPAIESLCRERPDLRPRVEAAVRMAGRFPALQWHSVESEGAPLFKDRYEVEDRLGSGAMGAVWAARDVRLGRRVAIKVLGTSLDLTATTPERFEREAHALAAVRHPAVVAVHDSGLTESGVPFLVMENVEGVSLADFLSWPEGESDDWTEHLRIALDAPSLIPSESTLERQMVRWISELAGGLHAAHQAGVVHRDIKPSNIMIRTSGEAVLVDFGIAYVEGLADLTHTGLSIGTPAYMAPEGLDGSGAKRGMDQVNGLDVWGLGATLYHALTGRPPYVGSSSEVIRALATRDPEPIEELAPDLHTDLRAILEHALERSLSRRYASVEVLADDLNAFLEHRPISVRPISRARRFLRKARTSKALRGAAVAILAISMGLGVRWSMLQDRRAADAEGRAAWSALPANLTVTSPRLRWIAQEQDRAAMLDAVDRVVRSRRHPVSGRALRASLRLDFGDPVGAKEDMRWIAGHLATPYAVGLANAYADLPGPQASAKDLELGALPAPETPLEHYLFGYHELRQLRRGTARDAFMSPGLSGHRHARELAVLCASLEIDKHPRTERPLERDAAAQAMLEQAKQLEADFGYRSAMSASMIATTLCALRRWGMALEMAEESLALSPYSVPTLENAALAAQKRRRHGDVDRLVSQGCRLIPDLPRLNEHWIRSASSSGLAEEALDRLESCSLRPEHMRPFLRALVEGNKALKCWVDGDDAGMREWSARAVKSCEANDPGGTSARFGGLKLLAQGLLADDREALFLAGLRLHETNELSVYMLEYLCATFPESIPTEALPFLKSFLETVRDTVRVRDLVEGVE